MYICIKYGKWPPKMKNVHSTIKGKGFMTLYWFWWFRAPVLAKPADVVLEGFQIWIFFFLQIMFKYVVSHVFQVETKWLERNCTANKPVKGRYLFVFYFDFQCCGQGASSCDYTQQGYTVVKMKIRKENYLHISSSGAPCVSIHINL